mgnify:CR=1 FL=1
MKTALRSPHATRGWKEAAAVRVRTRGGLLHAPRTLPSARTPYLPVPHHVSGWSAAPTSTAAHVVLTSSAVLLGVPDPAAPPGRGAAGAGDQQGCRL